jgi:hypothetical protein
LGRRIAPFYIARPACRKYSIRRRKTWQVVTGVDAQDGAILVALGALEAPLETGIEKAPQFGRSAKLRDGIEIFESRCERIG